MLANHKVELALDLLLKSARVAPNNFDNRIHLAEAFVVKGDLVRAKQELANAQRLKRNYSNDSAYLSVEKKLASAERLNASEAR